MSKSHKTNDIRIRSLMNDIECGIIDLDPEYQRDLVWALKQQLKLINDIMNDFCIPAIYLREEINNVQECLDGKQRLTALFKFYNNEIKYNKQTFDQLDKQLKNKFLNKKLSVVELSNYSDEEIRTQFINMNDNGLKLSKGEITYANQSIYPVKNLKCDNNIIELQEKFQEIGFNNKRKDLFLRILTCWCLLEENDDEMSDQNCLSYAKINKYYEDKEITDEKKNEILNKIKNNLMKIYEYLKENHEEDKNMIDDKDIVQLFYIMKKSKKEMKDICDKYYVLKKKYWNIYDKKNDQEKKDAKKENRPKKTVNKSKKWYWDNRDHLKIELMKLRSNLVMDELNRQREEEVPPARPSNPRPGWVRPKDLKNKKRKRKRKKQVIVEI